MSQELNYFNRQRKIGICITVNKRNLDAVKEFAEREGVGKLNLSALFDRLLNEYVSTIPKEEDK